MRGARLLAAAALAGALLAAPAAQAAPKRIVALTPFAANTVARLGVKPVAIGETLGGDNGFSPLLRGVPRLALSHPAGPNLERLATFNAQLVFSAPAWSRGAPAMKRLGMDVVNIEPRSVGAVPAATRRIGGLIGRAAQAATRAREIQRDVGRATAGIRRHPSVLLILGVGRVPYAFLANSWGGDVVTRAGGRLLTAGLRAGNGYARISNETVVARNPDIIIAVPHGARSSLPKIAAYLKSNPAWRTTRAARANRIYVASGNALLQPGSDIGKTITAVRRTLLHNA